MIKNPVIRGESLAGVEVFAGLDLKQRERIADVCTGHGFQPGETILHHNDKGREVFFILSGVVEVSLYSVNGRRITFHDKGAGQMVGELAAIDGAPRCATVTAKTDCQVASMRPDDFLAYLINSPVAAERLLQRLALQVRELSLRVFEFNALCVKNRIHVELLRLARSGEIEDGKSTIAPAPLHADIAARVSTHREAVTRELSQLKKEGLLSKADNSLVIEDLEQLEGLVEESLGDIPLVC